MKNKKLPKNKELSLKKQFKEAWFFVRESKHFIFITIALFLLGAVAGFIFQDELAPLINEILKDLIDKTSGLNTQEMIFFILQNNLQSSFISLLGGMFLGIFPLISTITNGVILGYVLSKASEVAGLSSWWRLLPHGIFELPAIFISFGLGISWGFKSIREYFREYKKNSQMKFYGSLTILVTLLSAALSIFVSQLQSGAALIKISLAFLSVLSVLGIFSYLMLFIFNKKLRAFQISLVSSFTSALLFIVIPLLILAAIIEGILIELIK